MYKCFVGRVHFLGIVSGIVEPNRTIYWVSFSWIGAAEPDVFPCYIVPAFGTQGSLEALIAIFSYLSPILIDLGRDASCGFPFLLFLLLFLVQVGLRNMYS